MSKNRIKQFDSLRFIFSLVIVLSHIDYLGELEVTKTIYSYLINTKMAVNYFFMLSGFGLYHSSKTRVEKNNCFCFALNRISKIYPYYIISLCLAMPLTIFNTFAYTKQVFLSLAKFILKIIFCLVLGQSFTGIKDFSHGINGVCWFVSCLFICYMLCPFFINQLDKIKSRGKVILCFIGTLFFTSVLFKVGCIIDSYNISFLNMKVNVVSYEHPIVRIGYVVLGMCIAKYYEMKKDSIKGMNFIESFVVILYLIYYLYFSKLINNVILSNLISMIMCSLLIYCLSFGEGVFSKALSKDGIGNLGKYAMPIFLFHYPINQIIGTILNYINNLYALNVYVYLLAFAIEIVIDYIVVRIVMNNDDRIRKFPLFLTLKNYLNSKID